MTEICERANRTETEATFSALRPTHTYLNLAPYCKAPQQTVYSRVIASAVSNAYSNTSILVQQAITGRMG